MEQSQQDTFNEIYEYAKDLNKPNTYYKKYLYNDNEYRYVINPHTHNKQLYKRIFSNNKHFYIAV
jgi:hypothetical protein